MAVKSPLSYLKPGMELEKLISFYSTHLLNNFWITFDRFWKKFHKIKTSLRFKTFNVRPLLPTFLTSSERSTKFSIAREWQFLSNASGTSKVPGSSFRWDISRYFKFKGIFEFSPSYNANKQKLDQDIYSHFQLLFQVCSP